MYIMLHIAACWRSGEEFRVRGEDSKSSELLPHFLGKADQPAVAQRKYRLRSHRSGPFSGSQSFDFSEKRPWVSDPTTFPRGPHPLRTRNSTEGGFADHTVVVPFRNNHLPRGRISVVETPPKARLADHTVVAPFRRNHLPRGPIRNRKATEGLACRSRRSGTLLVKSIIRVDITKELGRSAAKARGTASFRG
jgi:hypothetical protein